MEPIDAKIIDAVRKVRETVKKLTHDSTNPHDEYTYVSIDHYYQQVVPVASSAGLTWRTREVGWELVENMGRGKDRTFAKAVYQFDLFAGGASAMDYMRTTVMSPFVGAQTTGQLFSYADKVFMRVAFGIATGEKDADANKSEDMLSPARSSPTPVERKPTPDHDPITGEIKGPGTVGDILTITMINDVASSTNVDGDPIVDTRKVTDKSVATVVEVFRLWIPKCKTIEQLTAFHTENVAAIEKVGSIDPVAKETIKTMFRDRWNKFKEENDNQKEK